MIVKKIYITIGIILIGKGYLCAQQTINEFKTLIDSAVSIRYSKMLKSDKLGSDKEYFQNIYLINERGQALKPPQGLPLKTINVYDKQNKARVKKGLHIWKIVPVLNKGKFIIDIIDFYITYKKNNYDFANDGGTKVIFEFSCNEEEWKLTYSNSSGN